MYATTRTTRTTLATALVAAALTATALTGTAATAAPGAPHAAPHTEPVSVTPDGEAGNGASDDAVISRNGRYVAFTSDAGDLDPDIAHGGMYLRDLRTDRTRFAGFGDVVAALDNGWLAYSASDDVLLVDLGTGRQEKFGIEIPEGFSGPPGGVSVSPNGRYAVYTLYETGEGSVVFLRDRTAGTTERISHPRPTWEPRNAFEPTVGDDGRRVAYQYTYANGPRGDDWGDVWVYDRRTGERVQADRSHDGSATEKESLRPSLSGDGRTVVFESRDTHLVPDDTDGAWNVFVHDLTTGTNRRIHGTQGGPGEAYTRNPAVSPDGRYVTFMTEVTEAGAQYGKEWPVYRRDLRKGTTVLVTPDTTGGTATADVLPGGIAEGARRIAFRSADPGLIPAGDTNEGTDVFVRHLR
ncbi:hypothetical protein C6Y14_40620 [Streptomyces dioscori]|uniref:WD40 repeat protein n=1 Tax=Streptomyces dioscori TaxID=2109333 RepID=A0A2P8PUU4_9ACTN|nr:PD40 domain-containing protein [Streptomyces dioscori]PSM37774.1 hypothetical protein C6Y14_40620 [Streptomyces dioscori]